MDQYLIYGEEYKALRDAVANAVVDGDVKQIEEVCEVFTFNFTKLFAAANYVPVTVFHISFTHSCKCYSVLRQKDRMFYYFQPAIYMGNSSERCFFSVTQNI